MAIRNVRVTKNSYVRNGETIPAPKTVQELIEAAGMDYTVRKVKPFQQVEVMGDDLSMKTEYREQRGNMLERSDFTIVSGLGLVSDSYSIGTIDQMKTILEPFVLEGFGVPDSAAVINGGKTEILSIKLNIDLGGDGGVGSREFHLNLRNVHGGGSAFVGEVHGTELICSNGMTRPFWKAGFRVPHTSKMAAELAKFAHGRWEEANKVIREFGGQIQLLESKTCDVPATVDALLGIQKDSGGDLIDRDGKAISTRLSNRRDRVIDAARTSPGVNGRTLGDVYHGVTNYLTHSMDGSKTAEKAFESSVSGSRATFEAHAWDGLLAMAQS